MRDSCETCCSGSLHSEAPQSAWQEVEAEAAEATKAEAAEVEAAEAATPWEAAATLRVVVAEGMAER